MFAEWVLTRNSQTIFSNHLQRKILIHDTNPREGTRKSYYLLWSLGCQGYRSILLGERCWLVYQIMF